MVTGGFDGISALQTAEVHDPGASAFTLTDEIALGGNNMNVARKLHTATAY